MRLIIALFFFTPPPFPSLVKLLAKPEPKSEPKSKGKNSNWTFMAQKVKIASLPSAFPGQIHMQKVKWQKDRKIKNATFALIISSLSDKRRRTCLPCFLPSCSHLGLH